MNSYEITAFLNSCVFSHEIGLIVTQMKHISLLLTEAVKMKAGNPFLQSFPFASFSLPRFISPVI